MSIKPIFKEPFGRGERKWGSFGTTRAVTCELCGTDHPELDEDGESCYHLSDFIGRQVVEECCGGFIDAIYEDLGDEFTKAFLYEFAKNPSDQRFSGLRWTLASVLKAARGNLKEAEQQIGQANQDLLYRFLKMFTTSMNK